MTNLGIAVNFETGDARIQGRDLWNVVVLALTLLFLQLEGDAANGALLDTLHQMGGESSNLVAETF